MVFKLKFLAGLAKKALSDPEVFAAILQEVRQLMSRLKQGQKHHSDIHDLSTRMASLEDIAKGQLELTERLAIQVKTLETAIEIIHKTLKLLLIAAVAACLLTIIALILIVTR